MSIFGEQILFGVHTGLQETTVAELTGLWTALDQAGYGWISIWDHFYSAERSGKSMCLEAVAMHALLAASTRHVRCGALVYNVGYRHPAVLANAIATIDHISGGRVTLGLGCGWHELEHRAYGLAFDSPGRRLDRLAEAASCIRSLLTEETTDFAGRYYTFTGARCDPKPVQRKLPIIIGGGGPRRTLRLVAQYSDALNLGFVSPAEYQAKLAILHEHCTAVGRDPASIGRTVNLGIQFADTPAGYQHMPFDTAHGILRGTAEEMIDQVAEYVVIGVQQVNFAVRAPFCTDELLDFAKVLELSAPC
ncbi:MAG TPA: TIGR03560 family F420-dependent LLM class oxidoreductase [Jatrophihabitans sp.]|nr:TIGR03560 family F420-dependent LLM class oxidoreductase [Jatrophihabitans sp.]